MRRVETISYPVQIWIAGDHAKAIEVCRIYCDDKGFCVSVTPTTYVYTGGQETGLCVGLINYGRFPSEPRAIFAHAREIGDLLLSALNQQSYTIQAPDRTLWISHRKDDT